MKSVSKVRKRTKKCAQTQKRDFHRRKPHPHGYWKNIEHQKLYLERISQKIGIKKPLDWLQVSPNSLVSNGGIGLLKQYKGSVYKALLIIFPEIDWNKHIFEMKSLPKHYWDSIDNQRTFFDYLYKKFGFNRLEEWYFVTNLEIKRNGGGTLLNKYHSQLFLILNSIYPNYPWEILLSTSRFKYHLTHQNQKNLLFLLRFFNIRKKDDWYRISTHIIPDHTISRTIINIGHAQFFSAFFPDQKFAPKLFLQRGKKSKQFYLFISVCKLFPHLHIFEEYLPANILYKKSQISVQFDVFIPQINLAVEYNGEQHYDENLGGFSPGEIYLIRDNEKGMLTEEFGIQLVTVPYWWDLQLNSLHSLFLPYLPSN